MKKYWKMPEIFYLLEDFQGQSAEVMAKRSIPVHLWNQAKECSNGQYKDN